MVRPDIMTASGYRGVVPKLNEQAVQAGSRCVRRVWLDAHDPKPQLSTWRIGRSLRRTDLLNRYAERHGISDVIVRAQPWGARLAETQEKLDRGADDIVGACFEASGVGATIDHIRRTPTGWSISSVRGAASPKASHTGALAHAMWVLRHCGLQVDDAYVVTVDPEWRADSTTDPFVTKRVFTSTETRCAQLDELIPRLSSALDAEDPAPSAGSHCYKPAPCPHLHTCQPAEPAHSLRELYRVKAKVLKQLDAQGVKHIGDIPEDTALPSVAARQRRAHASGEIAVSSRLPDALAPITRPTVYIDFEAIQPALPPWPSARPFGVIPVQVSLHVLDCDDKLTHHEWLAEPGPDPRPGLACFLADHLRNDSTLVAYHSSFERSVLQRLEAFCSDEDAEVLAQARGRLVDLLPIVRDNVYHINFKGKFSLKTVVEALLPALSYRDLTMVRSR